MKLGITDEGYLDKYGWEAGLERMAAHGYTCLDYQGLVNTNAPLFQLQEEAFRKTLESQRRQIESAGITVWQTHGPWQYPPQDDTPEKRAQRWEYYAKAVRGTAYLGAKYYAIHHIMPFGAEDSDPQPVWDINTDFYGRLAEVAAEYGVILCLENMPFLHQCLARPSALLRFVKSLNSDAVRMCLDTGHCAVFGIQPADAVRTIGKEYLKILHLHDNDGTGDQHRLPFTGIVDWNAFSRALQEIGFDGCVSLETAVKGNNEAEELQLVQGLRQIAGT